LIAPRERDAKNPDAAIAATTNFMTISFRAGGAPGL